VSLDLDRDATWSEEERHRLEEVERSLEDGRKLKEWWEELDAEDPRTAYEGKGRFELSRTQNRPDTAFGFFGEVELDSERTMPVMACIQEMFYDRPKTPSTDERNVGERDLRPEDLTLANYPRWMSNQVREFVLRYFMRVSDFQTPEAYPEERRAEPPVYLRPISWCPTGGAGRVGFGFEQLYSKEKKSGKIRKFSEADRFAIVDLRELGKKYEWIVTKVDIFDFKLKAAPFGEEGPQLVYPLGEASYLVLSEDFVVDEDDPQNGDLGHYGLGYVFLKDPEESLLGYGPGQFDAAFQTIHFHVRGAGEVTVRMAFVANRPTKIMNLSIDPLNWTLRMTDAATFGTASAILGPLKKLAGRLPHPGGVDPVRAYVAAANALTGGYAKRELCISKEQLERDFLLQHFVQHYNTIAGSVVTWRQIPDWLDRDALPAWVKEGIG